MGDRYGEGPLWQIGSLPPPFSPPLSFSLLCVLFLPNLCLFVLKFPPSLFPTPFLQLSLFFLLKLLSSPSCPLS